MIKIFSRKELHEFLLTPESEGYYVLLISHPGDRYLVDEINSISRETMNMRFHDVSVESEHHVCPTIEDIREVLEWAKDKERIAVGCHAGVSRSSSMAFAIQAFKAGVEKAKDLLVHGKHHPNKLVTKYASIILGDETFEIIAEECRKKYVWTT